MRLVNVPLVAMNVLRVVVNHAAKSARRLRQRTRRVWKHAADCGKRARAGTRLQIAELRDAAADTRRGSVRIVRSARRVEQHVWQRMRREMSVRKELRRLGRSSRPIIVGPWLSEVGYEVLYWVPFLRWAQDRYRLNPSRLVVVSRGGVGGWYAGVADHYVELLELFTPEELTSLNATRRETGDQKQSGMASADEHILERVRSRPGLGDADVWHPSTMFRLLRRFWLGNDSLEYLLDHLRYAPVSLPTLTVAALPERFVAIKFYSGVAVPKTAGYRASLRDVVQQLAEQGPVVTLETGLALDEHEDYRFLDVPGVISVADWMTPQNNLAVQSEIIRRSSTFVGTCGGLAWLAPMLGVPTVGVFADDDFLAPHLYAARYAYRQMSAAPFSTLDLNAMALTSVQHGRATPSHVR